MTIWLISLFDPTPLDDPIYPRFIEIAKAANRKGHEVIHFTSTFRHTLKKHRFNETHVHKENDKYEVVFVRSMGYSRNMEPRRFVAHWNFAKRLVKAFSEREVPDVIFMSMPPLSTVDLVTKWGHSHQVPVVLDIIDPWPDSFIKDVPLKLKPAAKIFIKPFYSKLQNSFRRASGITAISNGYLKWAKKFHADDKTTRVFYLAIGFKDIQQQIEKLGIEKESRNPLRIIYAGSLSSSYDIPTILDAAKILDSKYPGKTEFVITGKGSQLELVEIAERKLSNIQYLGFVSSEELIKQYAMADLGLIQHKNNLTQTITYKFFNYMSAGLPLLNSLQSEMAELIDEFELGLNNEAKNVSQLVKNIERYIEKPELLFEHRKNVLQFTERFGDVDNVYGELIELLENVALKEGTVN